MNNKMIEKLNELASRNKNDDGSSVAFFELREIIGADDSQQKIEHLERRVLTLEAQLDSLVKI